MVRNSRKERQVSKSLGRVMNNWDCLEERSRAGRKPEAFMRAVELEQKSEELGETS